MLLQLLPKIDFATTKNVTLLQHIVVKHIKTAKGHSHWTEYVITKSLNKDCHWSQHFKKRTCFYQESTKTAGTKTAKKCTGLDSHLKCGCSNLRAWDNKKTRILLYFYTAYLLYPATWGFLGALKDYLFIYLELGCVYLTQKNHDNARCKVQWQMIL